MFKFILKHPSLFTTEYFLQSGYNELLEEFFVKLQLSALYRSKKMPKAFRDALRDAKLKHLLRVAIRLPFWRKKIGNSVLISQHPVSQMHSLPIMTKDDLRSVPIDDRTNKKIAEKFGILNYTSGSTGEPVSFFTDKRLHTHIWAILLRIAGMKKIPRQSVVNLWPSQNPNFSFQNNFYAKTMEELRNRREEIYTLISQSKSILFGFPSLLRFLSDIAEEDNVALRPQLIIVAGEALTPKMRLFLQERFHCKIVNHYGCREISVMAGECESNRFHENSEDVIIEIISEDGFSLKDGEVGNLVVTGLNSHIAPFIRYQLGDQGFFYSDACPCGNPFPSFNFSGRTHDVTPIFLPDGVHILPYRLTGIFNRRFEKIRQYQIDHYATFSFLVRIVRADGYTKKDEQELLNDFKKVVGNSRVSLQYVTSLHPKGSKVLPYIKSF